MEIEQVVFDKPYEIIITGDENDEHYGNWKAYQENKDRLAKQIRKAF